MRGNFALLAGLFLGAVADVIAVVGPIAIGAFPIFWPTQVADIANWKWAGQAVVFAVLVVITVAATLQTVIARKLADARAAERVQFDRRIYALIEGLRQTIVSVYPTETVIRAVLHGITKAAWVFDGRPKGTEYGANVMRSVRGQPVVTIFFHDASAGAVDCFLVLDGELSTTLAGVRGAPDRTLTLFALPVHQRAEGCLPGAPDAFKNKSISFYSDTSRLGDWCKRRGFTESIQHEVRDYFGTRGNMIRSFLSVALPPPTGAAAADQGARS
jgi:hypothetical protein